MHGEPRKFSEAQIAKYKERFSLHTMEVVGPKEWNAGTGPEWLDKSIPIEIQPFSMDNILSLLRSLGHNLSERELQDAIYGVANTGHGVVHVYWEYIKGMRRGNGL